MWSACHLQDCTFEENYIQSICNNFKIINKLKLSSLPPRQKFTIEIYALDSYLKFKTTKTKEQRRVTPHETIYV